MDGRLFKIKIWKKKRKRRNNGLATDSKFGIHEYFCHAWKWSAGWKMSTEKKTCWKHIDFKNYCWNFFKYPLKELQKSHQQNIRAKFTNNGKLRTSTIYLVRYEFGWKFIRTKLRSSLKRNSLTGPSVVIHFAVDTSVVQNLIVSRFHCCNLIAVVNSIVLSFKSVNV